MARPEMRYEEVPGGDGQPVQHRTLAQLVTDLGRDVGRLVRDEVRLASAETGEKLNQVVGAAVTLAVGLVLGLAALLVLLYAAVIGLSNYVEPWLSAVIIGVVVAVLALILIQTGRSRLKAASLVPHRTVETLRRGAASVREQTR